MNEYWSAKAFEEYKGVLYAQQMNDYSYQCERVAPHVIHNAQVIKDGNAWLCILGDLPTGVVGVGDTPKEACDDFDRAWNNNT